ncbi:hypothetical protein WUBG_02458 [Wuchereria bancrofti]|uniref:Uncharacterized protein n=1 Tax=Wuchereria bancrofti TaxID=6293 RepID=J9EWQ4_WUCBA|nr:hypothetical protein WUBG_02458 [Wuchereria bancrofti]
MTLSMQMLNLRSFPTFASITEQIMANIELIRQGFPPHVPIPNASISSAEVALSSYSSKTIFFERMKITVSDGSKETGELPLYEFTEDNVEISPRKETVKMYKISLPQSCCTSARQLIMNGLSLEMGSIHSSVYGTMDWDAQSLSYGTYDNSYMNSILDACVGQTILKIEPREAYFRLEGTDQSEALLGEIATIPLSFICEENSPIESIRLDWCLDTKEEMVGTVVFVDEENRFVPNGTKVLKCSNSQIPPFKLNLRLNVKNVETVVFQVQLNIRYCSQTICSTNMSVTVSISLDDMTVQKRFLVYLRSRSPFDVESKILTINNDVIENPLAETNFFIRTNITTVADMVISDISWKAGTGMETDKDEKILLKDEICCLESDVITVSSPVRFSLKAESKRCDLGEIYIRWRRNTLLDGWVLSQLSTGSVLVKNSPLSVEAHPRTSYLIVRTAIPVIFTIRNLYDKVIDLQMMLELADVFVFAGNKKMFVGDLKCWSML